MKDSPLDSRVICSLLRGLPVKFTTFALAQEKQSGMTHLCTVWMFTSIFFRYSVSLLTIGRGCVRTLCVEACTRCCDVAVV